MASREKDEADIFRHRVLNFSGTHKKNCEYHQS